MARPGTTNTSPLNGCCHHHFQIQSQNAIYSHFMKWLCSLLALLILILSVQPACADLSSAGKAACTSTCCTGLQQDEPEKDNRQDDCTYGCNPFQVCGCCAFSVVTPHFTFPPSLSPLPEMAAAPGSRLSSILPDQLIAGIWQPPRTV